MENPILLLQSQQSRLELFNNNIVMYSCDHSNVNGFVFTLGTEKRRQFHEMCGKHDKLLFLLSSVYSIHCFGTSGNNAKIRRFAAELWELAQLMHQSCESIYSCASV